MSKFTIRGGQPLAGTVKPSGNKNAALPMLAACTLVDEPIILHNVPDIRDVKAMRALIESLGASAALTLVLEPGLPNGAIKTSRKGTGDISIVAHGRAGEAYRFDVIGVLIATDHVRIRHVENAFGVSR